MKHFVAEIFAERPEQWGLRGDPFLWELLKEHFGAVLAPYPTDELRRDILREFERVSGEAPSAGKICFAPEFAKKHVGMSTGGLSADFWLETALPLLTERLERLNNSFGEN